MSGYQEQLQTILEQSCPELATRHALTFKNCFGAVAGYVDQQIFCSCGQFGFALKLPPEDREEIFKVGGKHLKYFPNGHVKKDYAVLTGQMVNDRKKLYRLIETSIKFSSQSKGD